MEDHRRAKFALSVMLAACTCLWGCFNFPGEATTAYVWGNNYPTYDGGSAQTILAYSAVSPQAGSPLRTLTLPTTCESGGPIAMDSQGQLYVGCYSTSVPPQVQVYPPNSTGNVTPSRTIEMASTAYEIATLAVDDRGRLYVGTLDNSQVENGSFSLTVYASGSATPLRIINLPDTVGLTDVAVDEAGNIYVDEYPKYVSNGIPVSNIAVYSSDLSTTTPIRTIEFSFSAYGVAVDAHGNIYVSAGFGNPAILKNVEEFAPDAVGNASPIRTIEIPPPTDGEAGGGPIRFDGAGNMFTAVLVGNPAPTTYILYRFEAPAFAKAVPIAQIAQDGYNTSFGLN